MDMRQVNTGPGTDTSSTAKFGGLLNRVDT